MASSRLRVWSSLSGLVFVVLAVVGSALLFDGPSDSSPAKMAAWYGSSSNRWHINLGWILAGLGLFSLIWLIQALVYWLGGLLGSLALAALIVGVVLAAVAVGLVLYGRSLMSAASLAPDRTIRSVQRDVEVLSERVTG